METKVSKYYKLIIQLTNNSIHNSNVVITNNVVIVMTKAKKLKTRILSNNQNDKNTITRNIFNVQFEIWTLWQDDLLERINRLYEETLVKNVKSLGKSLPPLVTPARTPNLFSRGSPVFLQTRGPPESPCNKFSRHNSFCILAI